MLPWALAGQDLGDEVFEVGPGPGLTTDVLWQRVPRLTAVEIDADLANRLAGANVAVVRGDGARLPFGGGRFSAATLFTMLHHERSAGLQGALLSEIRRVLRPGGAVLGTDGIETPERRALRTGDVYVPVDPAGLPGRLEAAGFTDVVVAQEGDRFRFSARAPAG
jgi:SAM-dependent methyltransferase